ncbi:hypothetical protein [uncultured Neisseria sp.]|uniref:hypothetical protein n=1 Tax=uncultured Neisseria sp. TaxID=237778 RepID=UPI0025E36E05|nr:hypothetical protein [uncultured Neisseria sp.]
MKNVRVINLSEVQQAQLKAIFEAGQAQPGGFFDEVDEQEEVWKLVRIADDYGLIEEAARVKRMPVSEFIAFAAAEYADFFMNAYEAAVEDVAEKIKVGRYE